MWFLFWRRFVLFLRSVRFRSWFALRWRVICISFLEEVRSYTLAVVFGFAFGCAAWWSFFDFVAHFRQQIWQKSNTFFVFFNKEASRWEKIPFCPFVSNRRFDFLQKIFDSIVVTFQMSQLQEPELCWCYTPFYMHFRMVVRHMEDLWRVCRSPRTYLQSKRVGDFWNLFLSWFLHFMVQTIHNNSSKAFPRHLIRFSKLWSNAKTTETKWNRKCKTWIDICSWFVIGKVLQLSRLARIVPWISSD